MSQIYLMTTTNPFDCIQQIQQQDQKKLLKKLIKSRKDLVSQQPCDPIISQLYIGFEQQLMRTKRIKTEGLLQKKIFRIGFSSRYQELTKETNKSQSQVQLHKTSQKRKFYRSQNVSGNISQMRSKRVQNEKNSEKIENQIGKQKGSQQIKRKLMNVVQKVYKKHEGKNGQKQKSTEKGCQRNNIIRKIKLQRLRKSNTPKLDMQWILVKVLKMETFFVKLIKNKINQQISLRNLPSKDQNIQCLLQVPKKQEIFHYIRQYRPKNPELDIESLLIKKSFKVLLDQDSVYFGETSDEKKCGSGVFISKKYKFQGFWVNDNKKKGYQITPQGYYIGSYKNNLRNGQAQYFWKNGQKYEGEWKNGYKNGSGVWKSGKGDSYIGQWANGKVEGYGVHITSNGQRYEGYFKNFLKNGLGKQAFPNGDLFEGNYKAGKPYGQGKYTWQNKIIYQGQFVEGYRHGKGTLTVENYFKLVGNFIAEKAHGKGEIFYENGNYFIGQFKQGQKNGAGTFLEKKKSGVEGRKKNQFEEPWEKNKYQ